MAKKNKTLFTCCVCGGNVVMSRKTRYVERYLNGNVRIPDNFTLPKCRTCGEIYISGEREIDMAHAIIEKLLKVLNGKGARY